jgi:hypothetical protein
MPTRITIDPPIGLDEAIAFLSAGDPRVRRAAVHLLEMSEISFEIFRVLVGRLRTAEKTISER